MKKRLVHLIVGVLLLGSVASYVYLNVARHHMLSDSQGLRLETEDLALEDERIQLPEVHILLQLIEVVRRTMQLQ